MRILLTRGRLRRNAGRVVEESRSKNPGTFGLAREAARVEQSASLLWKFSRDRGRTRQHVLETCATVPRMRMRAPWCRLRTFERRLVADRDSFLPPGNPGMVAPHADHAA